MSYYCFHRHFLYRNVREGTPAGKFSHKFIYRYSVQVNAECKLHGRLPFQNACAGNIQGTSLVLKCKPDYLFGSQYLSQILYGTVEYLNPFIYYYNISGKLSTSSKS